MIHPNRTYLLHLKEKQQAVAGSLNILKARRQALIMEFLNSARPFLQSRREIGRQYRQALEELHISMGLEGSLFVESLAAVSSREVGIDIAKKNILGVTYREVSATEAIPRSPEERNYDYGATTPHLEEAVFLFEQVVEAVLQIAAHESKLKKLGEEIIKVSRRSRVLEERLLPRLEGQIKTTTQYIGEREREEYFRLKKFKNLRADKPLGR